MDANELSAAIDAEPEPLRQRLREEFNPDERVLAERAEAAAEERRHIEEARRLARPLGAASQTARDTVEFEVTKRAWNELDPVGRQRDAFALKERERDNPYWPHIRARSGLEGQFIGGDIAALRRVLYILHGLDPEDLESVWWRAESAVSHAADVERRASSSAEPDVNQAAADPMETVDAEAFELSEAQAVDLATTDKAAFCRVMDLARATAMDSACCRGRARVTVEHLLDRHCYWNRSRAYELMRQHGMKSLKPWTFLRDRTSTVQLPYK